MVTLQSKQPCADTWILEHLEQRLALSAVPIHPFTLLSGGPNAAVQRAAADAPEVPAPARARDLVPTGRTRFWVLEPGFTTIFAGNEDGQHKRLTITVTPKTRIIDGIRTRIVLERQTANGHIEEVSENFIVIDRKTLNVFYFGEDVNIYNHGVVVSHESQWRSGVDGAKFGLIMPANPTLGTVFLQERAPGIAQDMAEVIETGRRAHEPAGVFSGSFKTRETTPLEPDEIEYKWYAPGIGLVQDVTLELVSVSGGTSN
ncbi:MAG TPA: hypothetical protein VH475_18690 [Tepidisphaeraceae bacterium]